MFRSAARYRDSDCPLLGELGGVANQVKQHLAQPRGIAQAVFGQVGRHTPLQSHSLGDSVGLEEPARFVNQGCQPDRLALQLKAAGFDLGEVENIVDQLQ